MVAVPQQPMRMTEAEYLAFEENSEIKHEFANGDVYAMTGGSARHSFITVNTSTTLNVQLADKDCRVASPDIRVKVRSAVSYRYPDVTVICGEIIFAEGRQDTILNPTVLLEVLSPSTALMDRNDKLAEYIQIPSLQEFVLISQHEPKIERFLRQESGEWLYKQVIGLEEQIELPSIGSVLELAKVYQKVTFDTEEASDISEAD
jgi:Uma2 family endonuclease